MNTKQELIDCMIRLATELNHPTEEDAFYYYAVDVVNMIYAYTNELDCSILDIDLS